MNYNRTGPERGRASALPNGALPRGLSRAQAAEFVGVSPTLFDALVADGRMPGPKCINARRVWDRNALDRAFAGLPDANGGENPWD
jgi:hypothetical protein